jgi:hypothetical protein
MTPANVRRILLLLFIALVGLAVYAANHSENTTTSRKVTKIEAASPCLTYGPKSDLCKESFEKAVLTITHAEACAILRKAGLEVVECAHARLRQERTRHNERTRSKEVQEGSERGAKSTEPGTSKGPSVRSHEPGNEGHVDGPQALGQSPHTGSKPPPHHHGHRPPTSEASPAPSSPPAPSASAAPQGAEPAPGNSDETPAAEHRQGATACVEVVVSACLEAGAPHLLP